MPSEELIRQLGRIEQEVGPLPVETKILLLTDGSVTALLEAITGERVAVSTSSQEVIPSDSAVAAALDIQPGELVNHRIVRLSAESSGRVLVYAVSNTPLGRLAPEFRTDLMMADIPIGRILQKYRMETRREITDAGIVKADEQLSVLFSVPMNDPLLSRHYRIIHQNRPLISIEEIFPARPIYRSGRVIIEAPSRLHIGLIDLNGSLGRIDGGIGLALEAPLLELQAEPHDTIEIEGEDGETARRITAAAIATLGMLGIRGGARIRVIRSVPAHTGLGSGTQLALATARALCALHGRNVPVRELARIVGRGGTSGIGTGAFESGGFIVDGGHRLGGAGGKTGFAPSSASAGATPAAAMVHEPFPSDWRICLVLPHTGRQVSGEEEKEIFSRYCPVPLDEVREICHELVIRVLPGLAEHDLATFGAGVNRLQEIGFKRIEISLQDPVIGALIRGLREVGAACSGLSSFGPAVYAITDGPTVPLEQAAREILGGIDAEIIHTRGRNSGAKIRFS
jgi:beta-ribofuranosylaminobenzene 5'-phosphate synthase